MAKQHRMLREHEGGLRYLAHKAADKVAKTRHLPSDGVPGAYGIFMRRRERGTRSLPPRSDATMPAPSLRYRAKRRGCDERVWIRHWAYMRETYGPKVLAHYGNDYDDTAWEDVGPDWGEDLPGIDYSYRRQ